MDLQTVIATVAAITRAVSTLSELIKKSKDTALVAEMNAKLIEIQDRVLAMQAAMIELQQQDEQLRQELVASQAQRVSLDRYIHERNAYWRDGVPYCMRCLEVDSQPRTLVNVWGTGEGVCAHCDNAYPNVFERST